MMMLKIKSFELWIFGVGIAVNKTIDGCHNNDGAPVANLPTRFIAGTSRNLLPLSHLYVPFIRLW